MRVGVIGDIHGNYSGLKQAVEQLNQPDLLLFTGDGFREISRLVGEIDTLQIIGVRGNCDFWTEYPFEQIINLDQYKVLLTHGHTYGVKNGLTRIGLAAREQEVDLVVFGHTHQPLITEWYELKMLNPGTLCRERAYHGVTFGLIETGPNGLKLTHGKL